MSQSDIEKRAAFDHIRYGQLWEDADVLTDALAADVNDDHSPKSDAIYVSICSAGDNALAMLTLDPKRIVVVDLSPAQIACLKARMAAYRVLDHGAFLELMGSRPTQRRAELLDAIIAELDKETADFWKEQRDDVVAKGLGGVGKFENYFAIFRRFLLPLAQSRATIRDVFQPKDREARKRLFETRWNNWRWRLLLKLFFSNRVMGKMGRDPAFFDHVEGSLSDHVSRRLRHAAIDLEPADNPYLHWILKGTHGNALPMAWREEHFETIRARLDRIEIRQGSLEAFVATGEKADGFNLSDIFEYMDETVFEAVYASILNASNPGARLVYWNMMVPRRVPPALAARVKRLETLEERGKSADKAFFYSDFVVEQVVE